MQSNAHNETRVARLARFESNPPYEAVATLLNSIANFFNNELVLTVQGQNYQASLMLLGVHASTLTIMEEIFDTHGYLAAFKADGAIWKWESHLSVAGQEAVKERIIEKYIKN